MGIDNNKNVKQNSIYVGMVIVETILLLGAIYIIFMYDVNGLSTKQIINLSFVFFMAISFLFGGLLLGWEIYAGCTIIMTVHCFF